MRNCLFCGRNRPLDRPKYCSYKCVKRAWWKIRHPNSYYAHSKKFWDSDTGQGFYWEKWTAKYLGAKHIPFNKLGADLDWNGKSVDVKSATLYRRKNKHGKPVKKIQSGVWGFNRGKEKPIDFFFCICIENNKVVKKYLIPGNEFPNVGLVMGRKSKYDKFIA